MKRQPDRTCANPECQLCKPMRTSVGEAVTDCRAAEQRVRDAEYALSNLARLYAEMETERDTARREAEMCRDWYWGLRGQLSYEMKPSLSWEREGPTGCGDSPTADVPTGVESGPVVPPRGYANRNGTSASEEPYNGARDGKMPPPNVYVTEWPTATDAPVTRAEFAALDTRERQHHIALTQYVGDSRAEFASLSADVATWFRTMKRATAQIAALRELALALASERQDEWVQEAARKVRAS